jgi:hypothetical protein
MSTFREFLQEGDKLKAGSGNITIDIDWGGDDKDAKMAKNKFKVKIVPSDIASDMQAYVTGKKQNVLDYLLGYMYSMPPEDVAEFFPEILA